MTNRASALIVLGLTATGLGFARPAPAATMTTLYGFSGSSDGGCPSGPITKDSKGDLIVTAACGGNANNGTVLLLAPPGMGHPTSWQGTILAKFDGGVAGGEPSGGVTPDGHGGYWGTNLIGGGHGLGTVWDLRPPNGVNPNWRVAVRWTFTGKNGDGKNPLGGVAAGGPDTVFGATSGGGAAGKGIVFKIAPPRHINADTETIVWSFTGGADGGTPFAPPISDGAGGLYGTTAGGGAHNSGTVYHLTPPAGGTGPWTMTVLYNFTGGSDGGVPEAALLLNGGNLYGICEGGGGVSPAIGTVWRLAAPATLNKPGWTFQKLYGFTGPTGAEPMGGISRVGNTFYTSAYYGGIASGAGYGTMISLVRTAPKTWAETTMVTFNQGNGANPGGPVIAGPSGTLIGTTVSGILGYGQIFQYTP